MVRRIWSRAQRVGRWITGHTVQLLGVLVVLLTLGTGVQSLRAEQSDRRSRDSDRQARASIQRVVDCLTEYSNKVADAIEIRGAATEKAANAELDLFVAIFNIPPTREGQAQARRIFDEYLKTQTDARNDRAAHPFPDPPRDACRK